MGWRARLRNLHPAPAGRQLRALPQRRLEGAQAPANQVALSRGGGAEHARPSQTQGRCRRGLGCGARAFALCHTTRCASIGTYIPAYDSPAIKSLRAAYLQGKDDAGGRARVCGVGWWVGIIVPPEHSREQLQPQHGWQQCPGHPRRPGGSSLGSGPRHSGGGVRRGLGWCRVSARRRRRAHGVGLVAYSGYDA